MVVLQIISKTANLVVIIWQIWSFRLPGLTKKAIFLLIDKHRTNTLYPTFIYGKFGVIKLVSTERRECTQCGESPRWLAKNRIPVVHSNPPFSSISRITDNGAPQAKNKPTNIHSNERKENNQPCTCRCQKRRAVRMRRGKEKASFWFFFFGRNNR